MRVEANIVKAANALNLNTRTRLDCINRLDLEPIKYKLIKEKDWSLEAADKVEKFYKIYLQLHLLYPHTTHVPTVEIDEMWHAHILDTAKYMRDCNEIFGAYLHHYPYLGMKDEDDAADLDRMFGETSTRILDFLDDGDRDALLSGCGGGGCGGGGGDGGGGSSCSSAPASCSQTPSSCGTPFIPSSCGSSGGTEDRKKKKDEPSKGGGSGWWPWKRSPNAPRLGLSDNASNTVNPARMKMDDRPDRNAVLTLAKAQKRQGALH